MVSDYHESGLRLNFSMKTKQIYRYYEELSSNEDKLTLNLPLLNRFFFCFTKSELILKDIKYELN